MWIEDDPMSVFSAVQSLDPSLQTTGRCVASRNLMSQICITRRQIMLAATHQTLDPP